MARRKDKRGRLSVFKGRAARLNKAIFRILALKDPLTIYDIHKEAKAQKGLGHIRYASINKRVRSLEELGYVNKIGVKKTKAGFEASTYELTTRACLAMLLNTINLDGFHRQIDETIALTIFADIIQAIIFIKRTE